MEISQEYSWHLLIAGLGLHPLNLDLQESLCSHANKASLGSRRNLRNIGQQGGNEQDNRNWEEFLPLEAFE